MKVFIREKTIKKLVKKKGVKRISSSAIKKIIEYLKNKATLIVKDCLEYMKFSNRRTLLKKDIELWKRKKLLKKS
ncbi:MAG: NFYB/HAP3 family transcription factor subunit [Candidatus Aenigmarchaeota archaeon]|nr:NFYB/HAP3 family transcription factor subunit [Candidatus Aenigmarchaeota archaeon]MDW8149402.1 NFYB/HAP3 family transcription factor subunit [Candidatus Aenigmarchaeota archaeon]